MISLHSSTLIFMHKPFFKNTKNTLNLCALYIVNLCRGVNTYLCLLKCLKKWEGFSSFFSKLGSHPVQSHT
jgi:hypothetical protein